jgi:hypothetical protein
MQHPVALQQPAATHPKHHVLDGIVFTGVVTAVFVLWIATDRAWVHPELIAIGNKVARHSGGILSNAPSTVRLAPV